jgi:hypothetical protein
MSKILIPVAAYHEYNTAVYVEKAFRQLGHEARVVTQAGFYEDHPDVDLFFGVDSAGPMDFPEKHMSKTAMWFIDSRHNNNPTRRTPDDDTNARRLADGGGWVFQAQKQDWQRNIRQGIPASAWLPLAADPDVWKPLAMDKDYDVGFGGNIWCHERRAMLERIEHRWKLGYFVGKPADLTLGYARSKVGFNVSGWYGSPIAYDVNMRVFEVLACGIALVTNFLPELTELGILPEDTCLTYDSPDGAMSQIRVALQRGGVYRADMGQRARRLILDGHTYRHRMEEALEILKEAEMIT